MLAVLAYYASCILAHNKLSCAAEVSQQSLQLARETT
jgi:hypothetical protein